MTDTRQIKITFFHAVYLCFLLLFLPSRFLVAEDADNKIRSEHTGHQQLERSVYVVRRAFWASLGLVIASALFGGGIGVTLNKLACCAMPSTISWLQIIGAMILLWATLFVRGLVIETWAGTTLTERVNQWLYRFLYCAGTAIIVLSLAWAQS